MESQQMNLLIIEWEYVIVGAIIDKNRLMRSEKEVKVAPRQQKLVKKFQQYLSIQSIYRQLELIPFMNRHLQFPLLALNKLEPFNKLTAPQLLSLVESTSFLNKKEPGMRVKIEYENAGRLLLITGIQKEFIESFLQQFLNSNRYSRGFNPFAKIHHCNSFWICIETNSEQTANFLKKYLRNQKRNLDESNRKSLYKVDKRRIRIIIAKEDLFTLLVDAMTETKADSFLANFVSGQVALEKRKSQQIYQERGRLIYRPLPNPYCNSGYNLRNESREEDLSDGFSESTSLNSDLFDPNKLKDIIETSDQGIQSENNISLKAETEPYRVNSMKNSSDGSDAINRERKSQISDNNYSVKKGEEDKHDQEIIRTSEILKCQSQEYGLQLNQNKRVKEPPSKVESQNQVLELQKAIIQKQETTTTEQQPIEVKDPKTTQQQHPTEIKQKPTSWPQLEQIKQTKEENTPSKSIIEQSSQKVVNEVQVQTEEQLYSVIPIGLMRRCLTQYKNRGHSQMIQLPSWLKSETEIERNRHRFFSSLCRPKLIHRRRPF